MEQGKKRDVRMCKEQQGVVGAEDGVGGMGVGVVGAEDGVGGVGGHEKRLDAAEKVPWAEGELSQESPWTKTRT